MRPGAGVTAISYRKSSSSCYPDCGQVTQSGVENCQRNESPTRPFNLLSMRWLQPGSTACQCRSKHLAGRITRYGRNNPYRGAGLSSALSDMEAALIHAPRNTEYRFLYCLLRERTGSRTLKRRRAIGSGRKLSSDRLALREQYELRHSRTDGESDLAETHMQQFLSLPAAEPESEMRRYVLEGFDRTAYLRTILP